MQNRSRIFSKRNSSIELLRLIAMFMILEHHFNVHSNFNINSLPICFQRFFFQITMQGVGKIGVCIFFIISAWFFIDRNQSLKQSLKRVWIMERELLFWSLTLLLFYLVFFPNYLSAKTIVSSLEPLNFNLWWYATAYALFLLFLPFLQKALLTMGKAMHFSLCLVLLIVYIIPGFIPDTNAPQGFIGMIMIYVFLAAYKWYMRPLSLKQSILLLAVSYAVIMIYTVVSAILLFAGIHRGPFITGDWKLPVILVAFGLFLIFNNFSFHSFIINSIAKSTFAIYLITVYPASIKPLWEGILPVKQFLSISLWPFMYLGLIAIFFACIALDYIRRFIFACTIDKHQGALFEKFWAFVVPKLENARRTLFIR